MKRFENLKAVCRDFLGGRPIRSVNGWIFRLEIFWHQIGIFFEELFRRKRSPRDGGWGSPPFGGKLAPIRPSPRSHLVAGKGLPPSEITYLWRKR